MAGKRFSPKRGFNEQNLAKVPKNKPIVYELLDQNGGNIYTGSAKRGRGPERLREHLPTGPDPIRGATGVRVKLMPSIGDAQKEERKIIDSEKPKHNKQ